MARGRHLSLEEARRDGKLRQFAEEHPSEGDEQRFDALLSAMAGQKPEAASRTSDEAGGEGCAGTPSPKGTSGDAS